VIGEWAGLRPGRTSVRLETEELTFGGKTVKVCEHYHFQAMSCYSSSVGVNVICQCMLFL